MPEAAFMQFIKDSDPNCDGGKNGYTHIHMQDYMKSLKKAGKIRSFFFCRLKNFTAKDLLDPRACAKRMKAERGDNIIVFGRACKSDTGAKTQELAVAAEKIAKARGASEAEASAIALDVYCQNSSSKCNTANPTHAVGVRFRQVEEKPVAELVDPAKRKAKELSVSNYAVSMAERKEVTEQGKEQYEAH